jgi:hypothetical protein
MCVIGSSVAGSAPDSFGGYLLRRLSAILPEAKRFYLALRFEAWPLSKLSRIFYGAKRVCMVYFETYASDTLASRPTIRISTIRILFKASTRTP